MAQLARYINLHILKMCTLEGDRLILGGIERRAQNHVVAMVITGIEASCVDYEFDMAGLTGVPGIAVNLARDDSQGRFDLASLAESGEWICNGGRDLRFLRIDLQM